MIKITRYDKQNIQKVKIVDVGYTYASYIDWMQNNGVKYIGNWIRGDNPTKGRTYKLIKRAKHCEQVRCQNQIFLIQDLVSDQVYMIEEGGLIFID